MKEPSPSLTIMNMQTSATEGALFTVFISPSTELCPLLVSKPFRRMLLKSMRIILIALLAVASLAGCASKPAYEQTSMRLNDGTTRYFIKTDFKPCQSSRDWATRTLAKRANEICKSGYTLIDEQTPVFLEALGAGSARRTLLWEIKCKTPGQPKS